MRVWRLGNSRRSLGIRGNGDWPDKEEEVSNLSPPNAQYNSSLREAAPRRGWRLGRSYAAGLRRSVQVGTSRPILGEAGA